MTVNTDTPDDRKVYLQVIQDEGPRGAQLTVTAGRLLPLPAGLRELTDAELMKRWGADSTIGIMIEHYDPGHPCDPVTPGAHECDGAGPNTLTECKLLVGTPARPAIGMRAQPGALIRRIVDTPAGYRWVAGFSWWCENGGCTIRTSVPRCSDGITGETLPDAVCLEY